MGNNHGCFRKRNRYAPTNGSNPHPAISEIRPSYKKGSSSLSNPDMDSSSSSLKLPYPHADSSLRALAAQAEGFGRCAIGGLHGPLFHVTTLADDGPGSLREGCRKKEPLWIVFEVSGTIKLSSYLSVSSYKTIDGRGQRIKFTGKGLRLKECEHVIICNLEFEGDPSHIGDRCIRVTIHHCFFDGTRQRHPRVRFAKVHLYNNYTRDWGIYAVCASVESQIYSQCNIYEAGQKKVAFKYLNEKAADKHEENTGCIKSEGDLFVDGTQSGLMTSSGAENGFHPSGYYSSCTVEAPTDALKKALQHCTGWQSVSLPADNPK
ncbi:hypothetical protein RHMOL_Rhmol05G0258800 [Rhododendron molle]|uniref:Uncharacterized protein n=1 Tax=Rhododendron molle TaxID=49168 RepID=A0ACC0NTG9_RHOML|nr:hypothetical protein RHMOL_Rhmol05G0258800 [Rhododendron molle]